MGNKWNSFSYLQSDLSEKNSVSFKMFIFISAYTARGIPSLLLPFNNITTANSRLTSTTNIQLGNTLGPKEQGNSGTHFFASSSAEVDAGLFHLSSDGSFTITLYIQLRSATAPSHVLTLDGMVPVTLTWNPRNVLIVNSPGRFKVETYHIYAVIHQVRFVICPLRVG